MSTATDHNPGIVLVLGASGAVGQGLVGELGRAGSTVLAVSRRPPEHSEPGVIWYQHDLADGPLACQASTLFSAGPLNLAVNQVEAMRGLGRVVALSSASLYFKGDASEASERDGSEQAVMARLLNAERRLQALCERRSIPLTVFRPAMIYGGGTDRNVERLADLMGRLPVVPVAGRGRRHPVHAEDLAGVMVEAVSRGVTGTLALGGGETLDYVSMLDRIARARGLSPRILRLPAWMLTATAAAARPLGLLRDIRPAMLRRQSRDLLVDDGPARRQLGWAPRTFQP